MLAGARRLLALSGVALGVMIVGGGGTMAAAPGAATAPEGLDHFKCYTTTKPAFKPRSVEINDQFVSGKTTVLSVQTLCNPVSKDKSKILQPRAHLICFQTRDSAIEFKEQRVSVSNQFGKQELTVIRPASLCVPSLKRKARIAPAPTPDPAKLVDHFRCYAVKPVAVEKEVGLVDQFTRVRSRTSRLVQLCNPVSKNGEPVRRPKAHLVCYLITDAKRFSAVSVRVRNQFGLTGLRALRPQTLCLPSFKDVLG
jgi:hypothetical protein